MWKCTFFATMAMCALGHCQETKRLDNKPLSTPQAENRLLEENNNAGNGSEHVHVHADKNVSSSDIKRHESEYFVSALFKKYSNNTDLTMDGFARLVCRLGLVPTPLLALADDGLDFCKTITFNQLQTAFEAHERETVNKEREHQHGNEHEEHTDTDSHAHHDHQPNRQQDKSSSALTTDDHGHNHDDGDNNKTDGEHYPDPGLIPSSPANNSSTAVNVAPVDGEHIPRKKKALPDIIRPKINGNPETTTETVHFHSNHSKCMSPKNLLLQFDMLPAALSAGDFSVLCPALIYQLDSGACKMDLYHEHDAEIQAVEKSKVWGFSTLAVLLISLGGLLGVAVIPIMQKVFYNHLLSFLVAVAVGALSGDAMLHLIPHAISLSAKQSTGHDHDLRGSGMDDHLDAVWKGLVAMLCIFFFFIMERVLTIVTEKKRRKKNMDRLKKRRCEKLCDAEKSGGVGAKLAAHSNNYTRCDQMVMVVHPNKALKGYADATHDILLHQCDEGTSLEHAFNEDDSINLNHSVSHSHHHHGQGHGHAHCDTMPGSVAAVAWMVILGDGIHNFSDGLAIGTAFASTVTGGISTSLAVLCHELPHEIGDFAVLLRAGMSVKQAVIYNCVSSILCFLGMVVGVAIGTIDNATHWVFASVGGMFLYISLVDMLPEMTAVDTKQGENQFHHLLLQILGMCIGSGIMLLIAVYEHQLQDLMG